VIGPDDLAESKLPAAVVPACEADVVGVVAVGDFDEVAECPGQQGLRGLREVGAAALVEASGDGFEEVVGGGAGAADDDQFGKIPGLVEADRVGPGGMAVVFDDVDGVPAEFVDVVDDLAFEVVGALPCYLLQNIKGGCHLKGPGE
jgi:hypothetical protein